MNKQDLIKEISEKTGTTKKQSKEFIDVFMETVTKTLKNNETVALNGFGTFSVKVRPKHNGINPVSGERIIIEETTVPNFKAGKNFKECVK